MHQHGSPRGVVIRSHFMPAVPNQPMLPSPNCGSAARRVLLGPRERGPNHQRGAPTPHFNSLRPALESAAFELRGSQPELATPRRAAYPSVKLTRYGSQRLAAPGASGIMPSAAKPRQPTQAA